MRAAVFAIGLILVLAGMAMAHHGGSHAVPEVDQLAQLYYVPNTIPQVLPQYVPYRLPAIYYHHYPPAYGHHHHYRYLDPWAGGCQWGWAY